MRRKEEEVKGIRGNAYILGIKIISRKNVSGFMLIELSFFFFQNTL